MTALIARIPAQLRDTDGIRLEQMLADAGAAIVRELRRDPGTVDLLVEDPNAPAALANATVRLVCEEMDTEYGTALVFERWERADPPAAGPVPAAVPVVDTATLDELATALLGRLQAGSGGGNITA